MNWKNTIILFSGYYRLVICLVVQSLITFTNPALSQSTEDPTKKGNDTSIANVDEAAFLSLPGGKYFNAIYQGDFQTQDKIAWDYLLKIKNGDKNDLIMGMFMSSFGAAFNVAKKDMTILEEIIVHYIAMTSDRKQECFRPGAIKKTYTYNNPEIVYEDGTRIPASRIEAIYRYNKEFSPICDALCERQGTLKMVAQGVNFKRTKLDVLELYDGVNELVNSYSCTSPEVLKFEANLIELLKREMEQPGSTRRNTFNAALNAPRPLTPLEKINAADAEFEAIGKRVDERNRKLFANNKYLNEQFMADNKKRDGVVELPSGMQYIMLKTGEGPHPELEDTVTMLQSAWTPDGTLRTKEGKELEPFSFVVSSNVYNHIKEGIRLLQPGGKIKLFIPSKLMYSEYPTMASWANQNPIMIYEYELLSIN